MARSENKPLVPRTDLYRDLVENAPGVLVLSYDTDGRVAYVNASGAQLHGATQAQLVGRHFSELTPERFRARARERFARAAAGEELSVEWATVTRDGQELYMSGIIRAERASDGQLLGVSAFGRDITSRVRADEQLRVSQERYRLVLDGTVDGVWEWDAQSDQMHCSARLFQILGADTEHGCDWRDWRERIHPEDRERWQHALAAHLQDGQAFELVLRLVHEQGNLLMCHIRGASSDSGFPALGTVHDVTAYYLIGEHLNALASEAHESVVQDIAAASVYLDTALRALDGRRPEIVRESLRALQGELRCARGDARTLVHSLSESPPMGGTHVLRLITETLVAHCAGLHPSASITHEVLLSSEHALDSQATRSITQVLHAALDAALLDGAADEVSVVVALRERGLTLDVRDNGSPGERCAHTELRARLGERARALTVRSYNGGVWLHFAGTGALWEASREHATATSGCR